jgi:hypothetical protein
MPSKRRLIVGAVPVVAVVAVGAGCGRSESRAGAPVQTRPAGHSTGAGAKVSPGLPRCSGAQLQAAKRATSTATLHTPEPQPERLVARVAHLVTVVTGTNSQVDEVVLSPASLGCLGMSS